MIAFVEIEYVEKLCRSTSITRLFSSGRSNSFSVLCTLCSRTLRSTTIACGAGTEIYGHEAETLAYSRITSYPQSEIQLTNGAPERIAVIPCRTSGTQCSSTCSSFVCFTEWGLQVELPRSATERWSRDQWHPIGDHEKGPRGCRQSPASSGKQLHILFSGGSWTEQLLVERSLITNSLFL